MEKTAKIKVKGGDLLASLRGFLKTVLKQDEIGAILAPRQLPMKNMVMPALITDPEHLEAVDPLSPAFPMNGAKVVSRLTRKNSRSKVAAVMRPCEIRAFFELVKLKQGRTKDLVIIGIDCLGAFANRDFILWAGEDGPAATKKYYTGVLAGEESAVDGLNLAAACQVCEQPLPRGADIAIGLFGADTDSQIFVQAQTEAGEHLLPASIWPAAQNRRRAGKLSIN